MKLSFALLASLLSLAPGMQAQIRLVTPHHASAAQAALGSPGIDAGDYVYVSGQGPFRLDGSAPTNFADQVRQSLDNVKNVVEAAGLTMAHVVYVQVYLADINQYGELNKAFVDYFPMDPPARAVLGA